MKYNAEKMQKGNIKKNSENRRRKGTFFFK